MQILVNATTSRSLKKGFTLLEILMVITLLGIVLTIVGKRAFKGVSRGKTQASRIIMKQLEGNLDAYRLDCNRYPTTEQGLNALLTAPSSTPACKNYDPEGYLDGQKKLPEDAWGNPLVYTCDDGLNYVIKSLGADGLEGGDGENKDLLSTDK